MFYLRYALAKLAIQITDVCLVIVVLVVLVPTSLGLSILSTIPWVQRVITDDIQPMLDAMDSIYKYCVTTSFKVLGFKEYFLPIRRVNDEDLKQIRQTIKAARIECAVLKVTSPLNDRAETFLQIMAVREEQVNLLRLMCGDLIKP